MVEARMSNTRKPATVPTDRTPEKKKDQRDTVVDRRCGLDRRDFAADPAVAAPTS